MQVRALALVACVLLFVSGAMAAVTPQPGYLVTVMKDESTNQVHALLYDPLNGKTLPSAPIAPWWSNAGPNVVVDASTAFGDWDVAADGSVTYTLFISNNAEARSQRMIQYSVYNRAQGWFAPQAKASCSVTEASSVNAPAVSSGAFLAAQNTFVGFTDFKLQPSQMELQRGANYTGLGLVSVTFAAGQCAVNSVFTFADGLPLPLPVTTASAIHQGGAQLAYVRALEQGPEGLQARMVLVDLATPGNVTLVPLEDEVPLNIEKFYAYEDTFAPTVISKEGSGRKVPGGVTGHPSFLLVQSFTSAVPPVGPVTPIPPPVYFDFCEHRSFHPAQTANGDEAPPIKYFPKGAIGMAAAVNNKGETVPMIYGLQFDPQTNSWSGFGLGPFEPTTLSVKGRLIDERFQFEAQSLAFIPLTVVNAKKVALE